jgi:hypothetical protein
LFENLLLCLIAPSLSWQNDPFLMPLLRHKKRTELGGEGLRRCNRGRAEADKNLWLNQMK